MRVSSTILIVTDRWDTITQIEAGLESDGTLVFTKPPALNCLGKLRICIHHSIYSMSESCSDTIYAALYYRYICCYSPVLANLWLMQYMKPNSKFNIHFDYTLLIYSKVAVGVLYPSMGLCFSKSSPTIIRIGAKLAHLSSKSQSNLIHSE